MHNQTPPDRYLHRAAFDFMVRLTCCQKQENNFMGTLTKWEFIMSYMYGECQVCGKTAKVDNSTGLVMPHAAQPEWSTTPPEHCTGSHQPPYEHGVAALAEYRAALLHQTNALALEHLNTAATENVDAHGRSWVCLTLHRSAFYPRGGVQWVLGRIMQTESGVVQVLDGAGKLHAIPQYKTTRTARRAMLAKRLAQLDDWHFAASQRAEWCRLRLEQWQPGKLRRAAPAVTGHRQEAQVL